jgi:hypothetical protein
MSMGSKSRRYKSMLKPTLGPPHKNNGDLRTPSSVFVIASFLIKLAKHLALIACLMIAGSATGRAAISQIAIFCLVAGAAVIYSIGQSMQRRTPLPARLPIRRP